MSTRLIPRSGNDFWKVGMLVCRFCIFSVVRLFLYFKIKFLCHKIVRLFFFLHMLHRYTTLNLNDDVTILVGSNTD